MQNHHRGHSLTTLRSPRANHGRCWMSFGIAALSLTMAASQLQAATELGDKELNERLSKPDSSLKQTIRAIETTVTAGNTKLLASLLDIDAVLARATSEFDGPEVRVVKKIFVDGTRQAWEKNSPVNDYAGTLFRFLRVRTFKDRTGLLFRSENDSGSINYYLFEMSEPTAGEYRIQDIYTFGLDEFASTALRRTYGHLLASFAKTSDALKYSTVGQKYVDHLQDIANMNRTYREGKFAQAASIWESLPAEVQSERSVMMLRVEISERISPEDRAIVMKEWLKHFPDEMSMPLKVADYYMSQNRWEEARTLLTKVVDSVGGDARMQFQLGQVAYNSHQDGNNWVQAAKLGVKPESVSKEGSSESPAKLNK